MKKISLLGFRGLGFQKQAFQRESGLIRAGHVGLIFEGHKDIIYGFHPTEAAVDQAGGEAQLIEHLKRHEPPTVEGAVYDDSKIFIRATELSDQRILSGVWIWTKDYDEDIFHEIYKQIHLCYSNRITFNYSFPPEEELTVEWDNCATFPRRFNIQLPEPTGRLSRYIPALQDVGRLWIPN